MPTDRFGLAVVVTQHRLHHANIDRSRAIGEQCACTRETMEAVGPCCTGQFGAIALGTVANDMVGVHEHITVRTDGVDPLWHSLKVDGYAGCVREEMVTAWARSSPSMTARAACTECCRIARRRMT